MVQTPFWTVAVANKTLFSPVASGGCPPVCARAGMASGLESYQWLVSFEVEQQQMSVSVAHVKAVVLVDRVLVRVSVQPLPLVPLRFASNRIASLGH